MHICKHSCTERERYTHTHLQIHMHTHTYAHIETHIHMHTHIYIAFKEYFCSDLVTLDDMFKYLTLKILKIITLCM